MRKICNKTQTLSAVIFPIFGSLVAFLVLTVTAHLVGRVTRGYRMPVSNNRFVAN